MGKSTKKTDTSLEAELGLEAITETKIEEVVVTAEKVEDVAVQAPEAEIEAPKEVIKETKAQTSDFRRMKPTGVEKTTTKKRPTPATKAITKQVSYEQNGNASLITFPNDRYGLTSELKKVVIHTASRIAGDQNKYNLVKEVLDILSKHLDIKFKSDQQYRTGFHSRKKIKPEVK